MYLGTISVSPILSVNIALLSSLSCLALLLLGVNILSQRTPQERHARTARRSTIVSATILVFQLCVLGVGMATYVTATNTSLADRQAHQIEQKLALQNVIVDADTHTFTGVYDGSIFYGHIQATRHEDIYNAYTDKIESLVTP